MAETLSTISALSFIAAGLFFVLSVVFWIKFRIPSVMGDLSGRTARKSIEQMRQKNEKTEKKEKGFRRLKTGLGKFEKNGRPETGLLKENETEDLKATETELLSGRETTEFLLDETETELLADMETTEVLIDKKEKKQPAETRKCADFILLEEIIFIHTNEIME